MICHTKCFAQLFLVAEKLLGCRNYTGMKIMEKEQKNDRFKVSDRNSLFRKRDLFLNRELRSDTLKRFFFCSFSIIIIPPSFRPTLTTSSA